MILRDLKNTDKTEKWKKDSSFANFSFEKTCSEKRESSSKCWNREIINSVKICIKNEGEMKIFSDM